MARNVANVIKLSVPGERWMVKYTGAREYPTSDEIAQSAYRMYEMRGREDGFDLEDWLLAKKEVKHHYS
jgi:hypothetical protein